MNELDILLDDYEDVKEWLMGEWTDRIAPEELALALKRKDIREWAKLAHIGKESGTPGRVCNTYGARQA